MSGGQGETQRKGKKKKKTRAAALINQTRVAALALRIHTIHY